MTSSSTVRFDVDGAIAALPPVTPRMTAQLIRLPLREPFRISDHLFEHVDTVVVRLDADGATGWGEAAGVFYLHDVPDGMLRTLLEARQWIEAGLDHVSLAARLPAGGARNALDCALWDLQAQRAGVPVWRLLRMARPEPLLTAFTVGNGAPEAMQDKAQAYRQARVLKLKLNGDDEDADRVRAVRAARPDVWLGVDANRSLTRATLLDLLPALVAAKVGLIEQPFAVGCDAELAGLQLPIPVACDESVQTREDLDRLAPFYQVVNIKLDKCGGLTEALRMAGRALTLGLDVMVGNMIGTSLAMAPAHLVGQLCGIVDLDGPLLLRADCSPGVSYRNGCIVCPEEIWGGSKPPIKAAS